MIVMNKERTTLRREGYLHPNGATGLPTSSASLTCVVFLSLLLYITTQPPILHEYHTFFYSQSTVTVTVHGPVVHRAEQPGGCT